MHGRRSVLVASLALPLVTSLAIAQSGNPPPVRLRGTIESISDSKLVLKERSGERIELAVPAKLEVSEIYPVALDTIQSNSFVGVGAMPQPDGTLRAIAVTVFPESARGRGEGHHAFYLPQSTMTNGTVTGVASAPQGRRLQVRYQDGEKTVIVPPEAPVVSFRPGSRELLVPGAQVALSAQSVEGQPTVVRISAGRNGFAPPY
jgi:hypothetical protein